MIPVLRSALFNLLFFVTIGIGLTLALVTLILPEPAVVWAARAQSRFALWLLRVTTGLGWELRGRADLLDGPALIASKHQSAWDTIIFFILCARPIYVMKRELMWIPVYGWLARKQQHIAIDRKAGASAIRALTRAAQAALARRRQVILFPEGTRVGPGEHRPYQPGIAALYAALGVPVVPVALNSGLFWGRRSFVKRPGTIVIEVLPPIPPGLKRAEFMGALETAIENATQRLIAEATSAAPRL